MGNVEVEEEVVRAEGVAREWAKRIGGWAGGHDVRGSRVYAKWVRIAVTRAKEYIPAQNYVSARIYLLRSPWTFHYTFTFHLNNHSTFFSLTYSHLLSLLLVLLLH